MKFGHLIIPPDRKRRRFFDGIEGDGAAVATFACVACNEEVWVPLWAFLDANLLWTRAMPPEDVTELAALFQLQSEIVMDSPTYRGHGSCHPVIGPSGCQRCGHEHFVCISYEELSPLRYKAVLDGVAACSPE